MMTLGLFRLVEGYKTQLFVESAAQLLYACSCLAIHSLVDLRIKPINMNFKPSFKYTLAVSSGLQIRKKHTVIC